MTANLARTADGWWMATPAGLMRLGLPAATTAELLADRAMFEHYTDGDVFDAAMEPGWAPLSVSGLAQWGPRATAEFTGTNDPRVVVAAIKALRDKGNEIDMSALRGLIKAMSS